MKTLARLVAAIGLVFASWLLWGKRSREERMRAPIVRMAVKHPWLTTGAMAAGGLVIAAMVVVSGIVPIKASSGHWGITAAFLDFAKIRAVSTYSWGIHAPDLSDEAMVLKGAAHYETACLPCHGGPGRPIPPVMTAMTPHPPELGSLIGRWSPEQLFTIVKHGIKFTGMPGWPVHRDDEIWAMVAFLQRMPNMDPAVYRSLVFGDESRIAPAAADAAGAPPADVRLCARCHGMDGAGRGAGAFPSLAGQRAAYLYGSLRAFRDRSRFSAVMGEIAARLDDESMREIASYYERLPARAAGASRDDAAFTGGQLLATAGVPERDIPACVECHGPSAFPKNPAYPTLAGQHAAYLSLQLTLLQQRLRGGTPNVNLMHAFVDRLRPSDIRDAAAYYSAVSSSPAAPPR